MIYEYCLVFDDWLIPYMRPGNFNQRHSLEDEQWERPSLAVLIVLANVHSKKDLNFKEEAERVLYSKNTVVLMNRNSTRFFENIDGSYHDRIRWIRSLVIVFDMEDHYEGESSNFGSEWRQEFNRHDVEPLQRSWSWKKARYIAEMKLDYLEINIERACCLQSCCRMVQNALIPVQTFKYGPPKATVITGFRNTSDEETIGAMLRATWQYYDFSPAAPAN